MSTGRRITPTRTLIVPGKLHSLNEYINSCRRNPYHGARMKKADQNHVEWQIRSQLRRIRIKNPVVMTYAWYEPNRKRDLDNISSYGRKIIQDALVRCGVLHDDGWKQVRGFRDEFHVDKKNPRIEIKILVVSDEQ